MPFIPSCASFIINSIHRINWPSFPDLTFTPKELPVDGELLVVSSINETLSTVAAYWPGISTFLTFDPLLKIIGKVLALNKGYGCQQGTHFVIAPPWLCFVKSLPFPPIPNTTLDLELVHFDGVSCEHSIPLSTFIWHSFPRDLVPTSQKAKYTKEND